MTFPPNSVNYVLAAVNIAASSYVDASISATTTETAVFVYNHQSDNTCAYPALVRFLQQEKGDDPSGTNGKQYFRWWSNRVAHQLASGAANLKARRLISVSGRAYLAKKQMRVPRLRPALSKPWQI